MKLVKEIPEPDETLQPDLVSNPGFGDDELYTQRPTPVCTRLERLLSYLYTRDQAGKLEAEADKVIESSLDQMRDRPRVPVIIGNKGGAGKTTVALTMGITLAERFRTRVVVLEANPDWGTQRDLLGPDTNPHTVSDVLDNLHAIEEGGYGVLQRYLNFSGRLAVLTAPDDPGEMQQLTPAGYDTVVKLLGKYFGLVIIDAGTSFRDRISQYVIQTADGVVLVATEDIPTVRKAVLAARYMASTRYEQAYGDVMGDLTVMGAKRQLEKLELGKITLAVNQVGRPGDVALNWEAIARQIPEVGTARLPYTPQFPALLNTGRLTAENMPVPYRRALKQLLVISLDRMVQADKNQVSERR